jgi:hypothetical protein
LPPPKFFHPFYVNDFVIESCFSELIKANGKEITSIMHVIAFNTTSRTITGEARDALVELIMKNGAWDELVSCGPKKTTKFYY